MLQWLRARAQSGRRAGDIYGAVVTAARAPQFYAQHRVPDTPEGRFEMVALMLFLVLDPLKGVEPGGAQIAQKVIEAFVTDMDDCMREMGVGDLTVPKKVKRAAAAFYERAGVYRTALAASGNSALSAALTRFVYRDGDGAHAAALADQIRSLAGEVAHAGKSVSDPATLGALLPGGPRRNEREKS